MAKAKTGGKSRGVKRAHGGAKGAKGGGAKTAAARTATRKGRGGKGAGMKSAVVKGEGLEVGDRRREADRAAAPLPRTVTRKPSRRVSSTQLPGEKGVRRTDRTVPVEPEREPPGAREPMPGAAVDRRRQIVGTDDKGTRGGGQQR